MNIAILEIKTQKITSKVALENIGLELKKNRFIFDENFSTNNKAHELSKELHQINQRLWDIEDALREKERKKTFDDEFIQLARSVYVINDERFRTKKRINELFGSELLEEKSYTHY